MEVTFLSKDSAKVRMDLFLGEKLQLFTWCWVFFQQWQGDDDLSTVQPRKQKRIEI